MGATVTPDSIAGRYIPEQELGRGGMGVVYRTHDRLTGQKVALKRVVIPMANLQTFTAYENLQSLTLSLAQEFRVIASLRHPNVISVLDYGFDEDGQPFFTMELLKDPVSLFRAGWRSDEDKAKLLIQILQALSYLHRRGIIHRDLKPGNVLVAESEVRVLDFGLAVLKEQVAKNRTEIAGTIRYIAPEIFFGDPPSPATDLYSVGMIGYELLTGENPFTAEETGALIEQIISQNPAIEKIKNPALGMVILQLLSKEPEGRPADAEAAIAALSDAIGKTAPLETVAIRESFLQAARFVGRDQELAQLVDVLGRAKESRGSAWLIAGESGVGKTRLLDELRTQALVQGVTVLRGQNTGSGDSLYQMWRPVLRWMALVTNLSDEEAALLKIIIPDIETLLERDLSNVTIDSMFVQEQLQGVIEKMFRAQTRPILLILEDLHLAGGESLSALKRLIGAANRLPLLIVGSFRDDERKDITLLLSRAKVIPLKRLAEGSIVELAVGILGDTGRQPELLEFLKRETEGNVFFLVETVRALAEQAGKLGQVGKMAVPQHIFAGGIEAIMQRRLERVPQEHRHLLQVAAAFGPVLDVRVLRQLSASHLQMDRFLQACDNTAVMVVRDDEWRFVHEKLRERVLEHLPEGEVRELHRLIANAIETVYLYAPEHINSAAYHWSRAGDAAKEQHYVALAGKQALDGGAFEEASKFFARALHLAESDANQEPGAAKKLATLKQQLGGAFLGLGRFEDAHGAYSESYALFQKASYKWGMASALNDLGEVAWSVQAYPDARQLWKDALKTAMSTRAMQVALTSITGIARLAALDGNMDMAAALLSLTLSNLAVDRPTAIRAERLLGELRNQLAPEAFSAAVEQGQNGSLAEVATQILNGA